MDGNRWDRVQSLFHDAVAQPALARREFLESACQSDTSLVDDVIALLEQDASEFPLFNDPPGLFAELFLEGEGNADLLTRKFGPYRLLRLLGEGGMGVVYLAERHDMGRLVAIKFLRDAWMSPARRERFANEQRTLAQLSHPSIARLYDADTLPDGTPWFAMEYVKGVALTGYCREHRSPVEERLNLFGSV